MLVLPLVAFAQKNDDLPLTNYAKGEMAPELLNKFELELMSAKKTKVIKGVQFERDINLEDAKANGSIICNFENYPQKLHNRSYKLTYSRYWAEGEANYISFSTGSDYFSIVCHKQKLEVTLSELNQAFNGLIEFSSLKKSEE